MFEINKFNEGIDFFNLNYYHTRKNHSKHFVLFKGLLIIYNNIKNGRLSLRKEEKLS